LIFYSYDLDNVFDKIEIIGGCISYFIFALKIHFYVKMKIRDTIFNGLNPEQYLRGFSCRTIPWIILMSTVL